MFNSKDEALVGDTESATKQIDTMRRPVPGISKEMEVSHISVLEISIGTLRRLMYSQPLVVLR